MGNLDKDFKDSEVFAPTNKELKKLFKKSKLSKTHTMKIKWKSARKSFFGKHKFKVDFIRKK